MPIGLKTCSVSIYMDKRIRERLKLVAKARGQSLSKYLIYAGLREAQKDRWIEQAISDCKGMNDERT